MIQEIDKHLLPGEDSEQKGIKAYLTCYAMLQLCLYDTLEEALHELLCELSPELHSREQICQTELWKMLQQAFPNRESSPEEWFSVLKAFLSLRKEALPKTVLLLDENVWSERLPQAQEMAEEFALGMK